MAFDPALVLHPDPTVRLVNSYEAVLSYVQARLSGADYTAFQTAMGTAGLPLTATGILAFPNPSLYVDALSILAMNFITQPGRFINVNTLSTSPGVLGAMKVEGDITTTGDTTIDTLLVGDSIAVNGDLTCGTMTILGQMIANSTLQVTGALGVGAAPPASGIEAAGTVRGSRLVISGQEDPGAAPNGTLGEDTNGDIYFKDTGGYTRYLARPDHDTGWIDLANANNYVPAVGSFLGTYTVQPANPANTPDIYGGAPMTLGNGVPGSPQGPTRIMVWFKADESAFDLGGAAPAATGTLLSVPVYHHSSTGANTTMRGCMVAFDSVTGQVGITVSIGAGIPFIAGYGYTDVITYAVTYSMELRVMVWTR